MFFAYSNFGFQFLCNRLVSWLVVDVVGVFGEIVVHFYTKESKVVGEGSRTHYLVLQGVVLFLVFREVAAVGLADVEGRHGVGEVVYFEPKTAKV